MERIASILLLAICVAGTGYYYMENADRLSAADSAAAVATEEAVAAAAAAEVEAAKAHFTIPHDRDVNTTAIVISLDASGSSDAEGDSLSYSWTQIDGNRVDLVFDEDGDDNVTSFDAKAGEYTFKLTVTDAYGVSSSEEKTVAVATEPNTAPEVVLEVYAED
jgi:chitinase